MPDYKLIKPVHPVLASSIEHYMHVSGDGQIPSKKILPRPGVSLMFDFSSSFYWDNRQYRKVLKGLQDKSFTYVSGAKQADHFVVQFSPAGFSRFTHLPLDELANQIIEPGLLFGEDIHDLYDQAENCDNLNQRINLIEDFLLKRYSPPVQIERMIAGIAEKLRDDLFSIDFKAIKEQSSLSSRQIERRFKATVGMDMQTYIRLCRFDHARKLLLQKPSLRLTDIGLEAGYYDQPHFSNDFKKISGVPPGRFGHCMTP